MTRIDAPGYRRYKNRRQTIRRRWQAGHIDDAERARLLDEARDAYRAGYDGVRIDPATRAAVAAWLVGDGDGVDHCNNEECLGARWRSCKCSCDGRWHGAAWGRPPIRRCGWYTCAWCGSGPYRQSRPTQRYCSPRCWGRARRARQAPRRRTTCPVCGVRFARTRRHRVYCSADCAVIGRRRNDRAYSHRSRSS